MRKHGVYNLVFSSSATVYGDVKEIPQHGLTEENPFAPVITLVSPSLFSLTLSLDTHIPLCLVSLVPLSVSHSHSQLTNPYGKTKWMTEQMMQDLHTSEPSTRHSPSLPLISAFTLPPCLSSSYSLFRSLEYHTSSILNPVGSHPSGRIGSIVFTSSPSLPRSLPLSLSLSVCLSFVSLSLCDHCIAGEDPSDIPNNLMPYITQTAVGKRENSVCSEMTTQYNALLLPHSPLLFSFSVLCIFFFQTHDGTGVRDYIHVVDLAKGHLSALK